jgi:hypothetical protein
MAREYKIQIARPGDDILWYIHDDNTLEIEEIPPIIPIEEQRLTLEQVRIVIRNIMATWKHAKWEITKEP